MRVLISQHERPVFTALAWATETLTGVQHNATPMPDVPAPDGLAPFVSAGPRPAVS